MTAKHSEESKKRIDKLAREWRDKGCVANTPVFENSRTRWADIDFKAGYLAGMQDPEAHGELIDHAIETLELYLHPKIKYLVQKLKAARGK